ncbi:hypothetical protein FRB94_003571 [Tulasnella sp. JGI-2019a]|nr:hypothetical protein FRB94_003571 [Tulasnella sp. JGI-2019a]
MRFLFYTPLISFATVALAAPSSYTRPSHRMLRKRLPTPLLKELYATSVDPSTGKDLLSPVTDSFHTSTFSEFAQKGRLTGSNSPLDGTRVTGPDSLLDDDILHITPQDQGIQLPTTPALSSAGGSSIGGRGVSPLSLSSRSFEEDIELLNLRPRRRLQLRRAATAIAARRLRQQSLRRDLIPAPLSQTEGGLANNIAIGKITEMTGLDVIQSTDSAPNLLNGLGAQGLGKRDIASLVSVGPSRRGGSSLLGFVSNSDTAATTSDPYQTFDNFLLSGEGPGIGRL